MALRNDLDPEHVATRLAAWLPGVLPGLDDLRVGEVHIPSSSGMSSESVLLTATWTTAGSARERGFVARVAPSGRGLFPAYDLAREARVMSALATRTDVPVPAVLAHEDTGSVLGAPFLLLERCHGQVPPDDPPFTTAGWVLELSPERQATLYDNALRALAGIHRADVRALGLADLGDAAGGDAALDGQLSHWRNFYAWAAQGRPSPTIDAAWDWIEAHRPPADDRCAVCWGDARLGNLMFGDDLEVTGVFDWEMAALGSPEIDLAYFLFLNRVYTEGLGGVPSPPGFPDRAATVARYEQLSGFTVGQLEFYEAFAGLRGAILLLRVGRMMIELGLMPADAAMPLVNPASVTLATLLDLPAPGPDAGWITGSR